MLSRCQPHGDISLRMKFSAQPHDKKRPIETRWPSRNLRPHITGEIFPKMSGRLHTGIAHEPVIVQDELKIQSRAVDRQRWRLPRRKPRSTSLVEKAIHRHRREQGWKISVLFSGGKLSLFMRPCPHLLRFEGVNQDAVSHTSRITCLRGLKRHKAPIGRNYWIRRFPPS